MRVKPILWKTCGSPRSSRKPTSRIFCVFVLYAYLGCVHLGVMQAVEEYKFVIILKPRMQEVRSLGEESEIACFVSICCELWVRYVHASYWKVI